MLALIVGVEREDFGTAFERRKEREKEGEGGRRERLERKGNLDMGF
jgi:hypothetical protein